MPANKNLVLGIPNIVNEIEEKQVIFLYYLIKKRNKFLPEFKVFDFNQEIYIN